MSKKNPQFIDKFIGDYFGETLEDFAGNLKKLKENLEDFHKICEDDLIFAKALLSAKDIQQTRRIFIRTIPPYIEGSITFLRIIPFAYPPLLERIPREHKVLFAEPVLKFKNRSKTKDNIKHTLIGMGAIAGIQMPNNIMGEFGAQSLIETFDLRDNLMHPRSIIGFTVSDEQLSSAHTGLNWYKEKFSSIFPPLINFIKETQPSQAQPGG